MVHRLRMNVGAWFAPEINNFRSRFGEPKYQQIVVSNRFFRRPKLFPDLIRNRLKIDRKINPFSKLLLGRMLTDSFLSSTEDFLGMILGVTSTLALSRPNPGPSEQGRVIRPMGLTCGCPSPKSQCKVLGTQQAAWEGRPL